jgi:hypothetical protein
MHRFFGIALAVLGFASVAASGPQQASTGKRVSEHWDAAYLNGVRAGYITTTVHEVDRGGQKHYETSMVLDLTLRRFKDIARQRLETGTLETADGKVLSVWMSQGLAKDQKLVLSGQVDGNQLKVKVAGTMNLERTIPWDDSVVGLYREQQLFKQYQVRPGARFRYQHYEPLINSVVTIEVAVKDHEELEINGVKEKLLRAEAQPARIMGVQLPPTTFWLDQDLQAVRSQTEMPGFGQLVTVRTSREIALSPVAPAKITDIGLTQLIPLNRRIPQALETTTAVYRITLPDDENPPQAVVQDDRQQVKNAQGKSFDLHVRAIRQPQPASNPAAAVEEFRKSNFFISSDDARVQELARQAVGNEKDLWRMAQKIEKWVHDNMKIQNFTEAMATADQVARTLQGDCTEYAMLTAAMCRAAGVPSRTAVGVVYVDTPRGGAFGYHMWTEVHVQGQWVGLDATLGRGGVSAAHIKIADHSWSEVRSLVPLLPVMRFMVGKPAIEVIRANGGN